MLTFAGTPIPGTHRPVQTTAPMLQAIRTKFVGVRGESSINGLRGGRPLMAEIWIHNRFSTSDALVAFLESLDRLVDTYGDLVVTRNTYGGIPRRFPGCEFEGFSLDAEGCKRDDSQTMEGMASWYCHGELRWYQLDVTAR
jgi:hypothetical protein